VIKSTCERLLVKGFESILRRDKEQMTNNNRQFVEKVTYLEKDLSERRLDYENEKSLYQNKVFEAQNELQQLRSTSKIAEEKLKLIEQEKHRVEASLQAQLK
jgi:hypothetical protein